MHVKLHMSGGISRFLTFGFSKLYSTISFGFSKLRTTHYYIMRIELSHMYSKYKLWKFQNTHYWFFQNMCTVSIHTRKLFV